MTVVLAHTNTTGTTGISDPYRDPDTGRLIIIIHNYGTGVNDCIYSDNEGATWSVKTNCGGTIDGVFDAHGNIHTFSKGEYNLVPYTRYKRNPDGISWAAGVVTSLGTRPGTINALNSIGSFNVITHPVTGETVALWVFSYDETTRLHYAHATTADVITVGSLTLPTGQSSNAAMLVAGFGIKHGGDGYTSPDKYGEICLAWRYGSATVYTVYQPGNVDNWATAWTPVGRYTTGIANVIDDLPSVHYANGKWYIGGLDRSTSPDTVKISANGALVFNQNAPTDSSELKAVQLAVDPNSEDIYTYFYSRANAALYRRKRTAGVWESSWTTMLDAANIYSGRFGGVRAAGKSVDASIVDPLWWSGTNYVHLDHNVLNTAPNAPTGLSPSGVSIDPNAVQRFSWVFSDPDGGAQSAYQLQYRPVGGTSWTTVSGGSTQYHDFAAGTFTAEAYEWQVRTTDSGGLTGPWSTLASFTSAVRKLAIGGVDPSAIYIGSTPVDRIYIGTEEVWS